MSTNRLGSHLPRFIWSVILAATPALACAQDSSERGRHHWGRFQPGTWAQTRQTVESFNEDGQVVTVTTHDTVTTIKSVDDEKVTLVTEVTHVVAGRLVMATPREQVIRYTVGDDATGRSITPVTTEGTIQVGFLNLPCTTLTYEIKNDEFTRSYVEHRNLNIHPFIFDREIVSTAGGQVVASSKTSTLAIDMPVMIQGEIRPCAFVKTTIKDKDSAKTIFEEICIDVPGGVVRYSEKDMDLSGKMLKRTTKELVDFGEREKMRVPFFHRPTLQRRRIR